jgi:tryptophan-rich sensory protein
MKAKTLKIINGVFWTVLAIALNIGVSVVWQSEGAETKSLVLGCILFSSFCICLSLVVHYHINEVNNIK